MVQEGRRVVSGRRPRAIFAWVKPRLLRKSSRKANFGIGECWADPPLPERRDGDGVQWQREEALRKGPPLGR